jgi:CubicO group peptidase (beta-lactamase class C family)
MIKPYILLIFICLFNTTQAQEHTALIEELKETVARENLTGAVWSTINNNRVTTGAIGLKNADTREMLEADDRVSIGSVTKTLIATGILRLFTQKKINIDAPIYKIVSNISFENPWKETNPVTIRHLLNHSSGIEDSRFWQIFSTKSIQEETYSLLPVGRNFFRKEDRVHTSHVLFKKANTPTISDGLVTYEKVNPFYFGFMWLNLILGVIGLVIILYRGFYLLFRKKIFKNNQIIAIPFLSILGLLLPIPFLMNQPFLNLGDATFANILLAIVTGVLPLAMIFGSRKLRRKRIQVIDVIGILFVFNGQFS